MPLEQESIPIGCLPPTRKPYMLQWPPPDVIRRGFSSEQVRTGLQLWPSDVSSRRNGAMARAMAGGSQV